MIPTMLPSGGSITGFGNPEGFFGGSGSNSAADYSSSQSALQDLIDRANKGDSSARDALWSYYLSEMSNNSAREWTAQREDSAWQRWVKDMEAAGLNPYAVYAAGNGGYSVSGSSGTHYSSATATKEAKDLSNTANLIKTIMAAVGTAIGIMMLAA